MSYLDSLFEEKNEPHFRIIGDEILKNIIQVSELESKEQKDEKSQLLTINSQLEKALDQSKDIFERMVISYTFVTGDYFIAKYDVYRGHTGKEFNDFLTIFVDSALEICNELVKSQTYLVLCQQIIEKIIIVSKSNSQKIATKLTEYRESIFLETYTASDTFDGIYFFLIFLIDAQLNFKKSNWDNNILPKIDEILQAVTFTDRTESSSYTKKEFSLGWIFDKAYKLKVKYFQKINDKKKEKVQVLELAKTYEWLGDQNLKYCPSDTRFAYLHFEEATKLFNQYGFKEDLARVKQKLDKARQQQFDEKETSRIISRKNHLIIDKEEERKLRDFNCMSLREKIIKLTDMIPIFTEEKINLQRTQIREVNKFYEVFTHSFHNHHGQPVFTNETEENKISLALYDSTNYCVQAIRPFLNIILKDFKNEEMDLSYLFKALTPSIQERKHFFNKSFELYFQRDMYCSLYLLIPQVENWFREEAYRRGAQTSNLDKNLSKEAAKTLTPVFDFKELKEYLGDDYHWLFEQLMNKEPMNLRNKIAHGLELNDNGFCTYFVLIVIKLLLREVDFKDNVRNKYV